MKPRASSVPHASIAPLLPAPYNPAPLRATRETVLDQPADDRRARDLLRLGELKPPPWPGERTIRRLIWREAWRPAGNSAKLWKKVGAEDPFAVGPDFAKPDHRTVYASGRFVRIDQADKKAASPGKGVPKAQSAPKAAATPKASPSPSKAPPPGASQGKGGKEGEPEDPAKAAAAEKFRELTERIQQKAAGKTYKNPFKHPAEHTPSSTRSPQAPKPPERAKHPAPGPGRTPNAPPHAGIALPASAGKGGKGGDFDRTPPLIKHQPATTPAGRMRAAKAAAVEQAQHPAKHAPPKMTPAAPQKAPVPAPPPPAPSPPPAAAKAAQEAPPAFRNDPPPAPPPPRPSEQPGPSHAPPALAKASPPASPGKGSKDLKVGQEINIPKIELPKGALNQLGAAQVVPLRRATKVEEAPPPESSAPKDPPKPRPPPLPGASDDLFGGAAQEGRVRVGRAKPKTE